MKNISKLAYQNFIPKKKIQDKSLDYNQWYEEHYNHLNDLYYIAVETVYNEKYDFNIDKDIFIQTIFNYST